MAYDGHILCRKCRRVLYLGKHKDGRFRPANVTEAQFAAGVFRFLTEHFAHDELSVLGDDPYERYLDSCPEQEWPVTVFVEADDSGAVRLVEQTWQQRG
jgi:hypothetical protein